MAAGVTGRRAMPAGRGREGFWEEVGADGALKGGQVSPRGGGAFGPAQEWAGQR